MKHRVSGISAFIVFLANSYIVVVVVDSGVRVAEKDIIPDSMREYRSASNSLT